MQNNNCGFYFLQETLGMKQKKKNTEKVNRVFCNKVSLHRDLFCSILLKNKLISTKIKLFRFYFTKIYKTF